MSSQWSGLRGIAVSSVALESVNVLDAAMIRSLQRDKAFQNPLMAAAHLTGAKADAMQSVTANRSSMPRAAFGILRNSPSVNSEWKCKCGTDNKGKFCTECGAKKPDI